MLKSINVFDYVVIGMYFFVMIFCGFMLAKFNKNDKDYFKASGKIPWPMASLSIFIGAFSAYMFVAAAGQVYRCGIPAFVIYTSTAFGYIFVAMYFAKRYRRTRVTSPMEYVEMRFGKLTKSVVTFLQIPILIIMCGNLLYVLCIFISSALGLKQDIIIWGVTLSGLHVAMMATGIVIIFYTAIGGLWAIIVTDTVQFIIAMVASVLLAIFSIKAFSDGGSFVAKFQEYIANPPVEGYFDFSNELQPLSFTLAWIALMIFSQPGHLPMIQRCVCVPDEKAAKKCCWLSVVFFVVCPLVWLFPVFLLRQQMPDLAALWPQINNPAEAAYVTVALQLLPNGMIGLVITAILAASVSSMAGCFNMVSVIFTNDIYNKVIDTKASPRKLMLIGKITSIVIGCLAVFVGILLSGFSDAFRTTFTIISHTGLAMALPIVLGLIYKRIPWWTGIIAMISCFTVTLSLELLIPIIAKYSSMPLWPHIKGHLFEYKVGGAIFINFVVFSILTFFYKPSNAARGAQKLHMLLQKPISQDSDHIAVVVPDLRPYRVVAMSLFIFGVPLALCKTLNLVEDVQSINLYAGLTFLALSMLIFWLTSPRISPFKIVRQ